MNASTRKSIRTALQTAAACVVVLAGLVPILGLNTGKYAAVGAAIIAVAALVTKLQTSAEAAGKIGTILNPATPPSPVPVHQSNVNVIPTQPTGGNN